MFVEDFLHDINPVGGYDRRAATGPSPQDPVGHPSPAAGQIVVVTSVCLGFCYNQTVPHAQAVKMHAYIFCGVQRGTSSNEEWQKKDFFFFPPNSSFLWDRELRCVTSKSVYHVGSTTAYVKIHSALAWAILINCPKWCHFRQHGSEVGTGNVCWECVFLSAGHRVHSDTEAVAGCWGELGLQKMSRHVCLTTTLWQSLWQIGITPIPCLYLFAIFN